ncbi:Glycosyltransferase, GT2 family [Mesorhizobium albiziae]|uniref:Glycosyltransferase, GT2 family n=1 Tax=Neomesorhizobium albiziae TaxID=335020 RepID=A0A1I4ERE7_9HYPH|nr:glycosyltransferase family 2 protein [Mesorhizobium albiziae]GLS31371.1 glycosyl transferase [Mesorhizobium albiziae]SFL06721.1 Glycosyltransferase, GT2 family [Mesorhizobium albiziae]
MDASFSLREPRERPPRRDIRPRIAVGIATTGRADTLCKTLNLLSDQLRFPDAVFISAPTAADVKGVAACFPTSTITLGHRGLTRQRNVILEMACEKTDLLVFIDDDFLPGRAYLQETLAAFADHPDAVMTTGHVVRDGIRGPGLDFDSALAELTRCDQQTCSEEIRDVEDGYGCNMAMRLAVASAHGVRFDEDLPLYGWLEDVDFSHRLAKYGRIVAVPRAKGIHLGIKRGRQSGVRLGYSQIANPYHLARKGSVSWRRSFYLASRNIAANLFGLIKSEPYIDRVGRLTGNVKALADLAKGRISPLRILSL